MHRTRPSLVALEGGIRSMGLKIIGTIVVMAVIVVGVQTIYTWVKEKNVDR